MYTDQVPKNDLSRDIAAKHAVKIYPTVRDTLTLGGNKLAVDAAVLIGEARRLSLQRQGPEALSALSALSADRRRVPRIRPRRARYIAISIFPPTGPRRSKCTTRRASCGFRLWLDPRCRFRGAALRWSWTWARPWSTPSPSSTAARRRTGFTRSKRSSAWWNVAKGGETGIASVECVEGPGVWTWTDAQPWAARLLDAALVRSETKKTRLAARRTSGRRFCSGCSIAAASPPRSTFSTATARTARSRPTSRAAPNPPPPRYGCNRDGPTAISAR